MQRLMQHKGGLEAALQEKKSWPVGLGTNGDGTWELSAEGDVVPGGLR